MFLNEIPQEICMSLNSLHIMGFDIGPHGVVFNVLLINSIPLHRPLGKRGQSTVKLANQEGLLTATHTIGGNNIGCIRGEMQMLTTLCYSCKCIVFRKFYLIQHRCGHTFLFLIGMGFQCKGEVAVLHADGIQHHRLIRTDQGQSHHLGAATLEVAFQHNLITPLITGSQQQAQYNPNCSKTSHQFMQ